MKMDVAVIGSGLTGCAAAFALKSKGKRVEVFSRSPGTTSVSSGCWDFGSIPLLALQDYEALSSAWAGVLSSYLVDRSIAPLAEAKDAVESLRDTLAPFLKMSVRFEKAFCLPTSTGSLKRTFVAQGVQARADLAGFAKKRVGFVYSPAWRFEARSVFATLKGEATRMSSSLDLSPCELTRASEERDIPLSRVAASLAFQPAALDALIGGLSAALKKTPMDVLLFPPIFLSDALADRVASTLGVEVAECVSTTEPVAGYRLQNALEAALGAQGIPLHKNAQLKSTSKEATASLEGIEAQSFILASGKFFGGGIHFGYDTLKESVFDLPLFIERGHTVLHRTEIPWRWGAFGEEQPWSCVGVWVDNQWRPLDRGARPVFSNLRACGSVVGGLDFARREVGLGTMAWTGRQCGLSIP